MVSSGASSNIARDRLLSLIEFARQAVGSRTNRASSIAEHRLLEAHDHELHGLPGIWINVDDLEDEIWLGVERLHEIERPAVEDSLLLPWIEIVDDPTQEPYLKEATDGPTPNVDATVEAAISATITAVELKNNELQLSPEVSSNRDIDDED